MTAAVVVLCAASAGAYPDPAGFNTEVGRGGTGEQLFTGSPRFKRYDCRMCHAPKSNTIEMVVKDINHQMIVRQTYQPGLQHELVFKVEEEKATSMQFEFLDDALRPVVSDLQLRSAGGTLYSKGANKIAEGVYTVPLDIWASLVFTAPPAGTGRITLWAAVVSGDDGTILDDAVVVTQMRFCEQGVACDTGLEQPEAELHDSPASHGCALVPRQLRANAAGWLAGWLLLILVWRSRNG